MNLDRIGKLIECLFEKHRLVRRTTLLTAVALLPFIAVWLFHDPAEVSMGAATAFSAYTTMVAAMMKFYGDSRADQA